MVLGEGGLGTGQKRRNTPLYVIPMALALVLAAVLGAGVGLVWQSSGFADEDGEAQGAGEEIVAEPSG